MPLSLALLFLVGAAPPAAGPVTYTLDPARSALFVQVFKDPDTFGSGLSHDHVVAATGWTGTVTWDPADPAACAVRITVPVAGLRPDEDALRARVGYDAPLSEDQRGKIAESMRGDSQLDAQRFPSITYRATRCDGPLDALRVTGDLSIHGVTKPVTTTLAVTADGRVFTARGSFSARATDFGFEPYTALMGALKNRDEMKFTLDLKGSGP